MRKIHKLISAVALALAASKASAQVLYEPFNYTVGTNPLETTAADLNKNYTTSGTYWAQRGSTAPPFTVGSGLGSPNFQGVATPPVLPPTMGGSGQFSSSNSGRTPDVGFGQVFSSGDVYYSLSFKIPAGGLATAGAGNMIGFSNFAIPSTNATTTFQAGLRLIPSTTTAYQLGMTSGGVTQQFTGKTFGTADTVFIVARYRIVPGATANDQVAMWFNPTANFGGDEASIPAPDLSWTHTGSDSTHDLQPTSTPQIAGWFMRSYGATSNLQIDELRVDSKWAGVTPNGNLQYTWTDAGAGANTFANPDKWTKLAGAPATAPNGVGHVANFGAGIAGGSTVTSAGETFDTINFNNAGGVTIDGTGLTVGSNASAGQIYAYAGSHAINAPIAMGSNLSIKAATGATVTLGAAVTGANTLGVYGTGTVRLGAGGSIDDAARLEVRSGTLDLNGADETVASFQLGTGAINSGTALPALYNGDLASGTVTSGTITSNNIDLQSGTISAAVAGTNGVVKNNAGFVTLSGTNTYTGNTVVNSGQLTLSGTNTNPVNAVINLTPQISGAINNLALTSNASLGAAGASVTWTPNVNVSSGTLLLNDDMTITADRVLNINHSASRIGVAANKTASIQSVLSGTGGVGVAGAGTLILDAVNTYSGNTSLFSGTLLVGNQNQIGNGSATNNLVLGSGTFKESAALGTVSKTVALIAGGNGTIDTNGFDTTFSGVISGAAIVGPPAVVAGNLVKAGAGRLTLTGANTYDGITTIDLGALRITAANGLGSAAGRTVISGGGGVTSDQVLEIDGSAGNIAVADEVRIGGKTSTGAGNATASVRNVAGNNSISTLQLNAGGTWYNIDSDVGKLTLGTITNTLTGSNRHLNLGGAGDGEITGALTATSATDTYFVNKFGAGTWTLSGANSYNGATTVNAGTLRTTGAGTLGAANGAVVNNGTLQLYSNNTVGGISGTGSTVVGDGATGVNVQAKHVRQANLSVADGSTLTVAASMQADGVSNVGALSIAPNGKLDLNANKLLTSTPAGTFDGTAYNGVQGEIQRAYNFGAWDQPGLTTSQPNAGQNAGPLSGTTTIGVATAEQVLFVGPTETTVVFGQTVTGATTIAMYTYAGDVNFDGLVDGADYGTLDNWIQFPGTDGYANGDVNYDGVIDGADYGVLDNTIQLQGEPIPGVFSAFASESSASLSGVTAVPEPTACGFAVLGAAALLGRRRRRTT